MIAEPESRYTVPTTTCPNPGWWTSTDDESTEVEVSELLAGIVRGLQPEFCIETGTAHGQTTAMIGEALKRNGHGVLHGLEPDPVKVQECRERCEGLPVEILEMSSMDYEPPGPVDFAFFDSIFDLRLPEFQRYRPFMHPGTFVAFHDTAPGHGVIANTDLRGAIEAGMAGEVALLDFFTPRGLTIGAIR